MARSDLVRHRPFLPTRESGRLEALARGPGASKSIILVEALAAFLDRKGGGGIEGCFAQRLDGLSSQLAGGLLALVAEDER